MVAERSRPAARTKPLPPTAILVTAFSGDPTLEERRAAAAAGRVPRKDYVELARMLGNSVVIDASYMDEQAGRLARLVRRLAGMPAAQITEVFLRRRRFGTIVAWADRLGVGLALVSQLTRVRLDLVLVSVLLTRGAKGRLVGRLRILDRVRVVVARRWQAQLLEERFGIDPSKLWLATQGVDEDFFTPAPGPPPQPLACSVGLEERDHGTLLRAAARIDGRVELAVGTIAEAVDAPAGRARIEELMGGALPPNVGVGNYAPAALRELYQRSSCAIIAINDIEFDAGVTAATEAMACGLPLVATRTAGLADLFSDGVEGVYVTPGDAAELAAAVQGLLDEPERAAAMGAAARRLVEARHRLEDSLLPIAEAVRTGVARA